MTTLPDNLELAALGALIRGVLQEDSLDEKYLSRIGLHILKAYRDLENPSFQDILVYIVDVQNQDANTYKQALLRADSLSQTSNPTQLIEKWVDRQVLLQIQNECTKQLAGDANVQQVRSILDQRRPRVSNATPLSLEVGDTVPAPPVGLPIYGFPNLTEWTGGLQFMWAIGGEPGIGKSTLAFQFACSWLRQGRKVFHYDRENSSAEFIRRGYDVFGGLEPLRSAFELLYYRDDFSTLQYDLDDQEQPVLLIIDSIQKVPTKSNQRRESLDTWIHRFEEIKKSGHTVILLSELNKQSYDNPNLAAYKETGEVEYAADIGIQLRECRETDDLVECRLVKDRPRPYKGNICYLRRKNFGCFEEVSTEVNPWK